MKRWTRTILPLLLGGLLLGCGDKARQESPQENARNGTTDSESAATDSTRVFHILAFDGVQNFRYLVHFHDPGRAATLYTFGEVHELQAVPTASGARYQGDRLMVWVKGEEVLFEVDGKRVGPCKISGLQSILSRAWLAGTDFWASGNEPSWNLIIGQERVVLLTDQGQTRHEFPGLTRDRLDPRHPYGQYRLEADGHVLEIDIIDGLCGDTMSGAPFPASVLLRWNEQEWRGCGTGLF